MLLDPFLTYCPNCGTLARIRQTQTEPPRLVLSRCAVLFAGVFSALSIFLNFALVLEAATWARYNEVVLIFFVIVFSGMSLLSFVGTVYGFESAQKRWNADRLRLVVFSARSLVFLGSLDLILGSILHVFILPFSIFVGTMRTPRQVVVSIVGSTASILLATGAFVILLSLPGLIVATRRLKREEAEASYVLS